MAAPRVRFAPSPTGYLHVGGARTALFNWLFARREGGALVLRIEDTDRERSQSELSEAIISGLDWLGLSWDEGPFHQADYVERHRADVERLLDGGSAYRCFCPPERLEALRAAARERGTAAAYDGRCRRIAASESGRRAAAGEPHAIRFAIPEGVTEWNDEVGGQTRFQNADVEDFVVLRSDGTPTYNLAVVSDDAAMEITHVIRGADHISNTPKQIQMYRALSREPPVFCHVPLILGPDGKRLSKRHGAMAVGEYRKMGFLPDAMVNFLALLGWSPGDDTEVMASDELTERFSLDRINSKPAVFDEGKLEWFNRQHLSRRSPAALRDSVLAKLIEAGIGSGEDLEDRSEWLERVIDSLKVRARTLNDLAARARPFFAGEVELEPEAVAKHWKDREATEYRLSRLRSALADHSDWSEAALEDRLRGVAEELELGAGKLIHPLRVALTGSAVSPGIFEVMNLMGRELVIERIDSAIERLAIA